MKWKILLTFLLLLSAAFATLVVVVPAGDAVWNKSNTMPIKTDNTIQLPKSAGLVDLSHFNLTVYVFWCNDTIIEGANVTVYKGWGVERYNSTGTTNSSGCAVFYNVPQGDFWVIASYAEYKYGLGVVYWGHGEKTVLIKLPYGGDLPFEIVQSIDFERAENGTVYIQGYVGSGRSRILVEKVMIEGAIKWPMNISVVLSPCQKYFYPHVAIGRLDEYEGSFVSKLYYRVWMDGQWGDEQILTQYYFYNWQPPPPDANIWFELNLLARGNEVFIYSGKVIMRSYVHNFGPLRVSLDELAITVRDQNGSIALNWNHSLEITLDAEQEYVFPETYIGYLENGTYDYEAKLYYSVLDNGKVLKERYETFGGRLTVGAIIQVSEFPLDLNFSVFLIATLVAVIVAKKKTLL